MRIVYHGHSFVEIIERRGSVLIDPFISGNSLCDVSYDTIIKKNITAIILTHGHSDHVGDSVAIAQVCNCPVIATFELAEYLHREQDVEHVEAIGIGGRLVFDTFSVKYVPAWHGGGITSFDHGYTTVAAGVMIGIGDITIYHAGDTALFGDMKLFGELYRIDVAFLPIGDRFTMGVEDAALAASWIKAKVVVPIHYNTWPVIKADPEDFVRAVAHHAVATDAVVMHAGDEMTL